MKWCNLIAAGLFAASVPAASAPPKPVLDLSGYTSGEGAISVLHEGSSADPYFAMQALLLAHDNGMDATAATRNFINWLMPLQKPDGTFDRFCRNDANLWRACKTADADDSQLALWMRLLQTDAGELQTNPVWIKSAARSKASLVRLLQPSRGIYVVSPVYLHGLFMDNLEVWSYQAGVKRPAQTIEANKLAQSIQTTFWDGVNQRYLVSTQLEQQAQERVFYPDHVAQIFPLLVGFSPPQTDPHVFYKRWMTDHRSDWLRQSEADYPWGIVAVLALREKDKISVNCWLRQAAPLRHSSRWAVTDETAYQIVTQRGAVPAAADTNCH